MMDVNKVSVRIADGEYTLRGVEPEEYIRQVAGLVDRKYVEISRLNRSLSTSMAAVLTAVNIADEMLKNQEAQRAFERETQDMRRKSQAMADELIRIKGENERLKLDNERLRLSSRETVQPEIEAMRAEIESMRARTESMRAETESAHARDESMRAETEQLRHEMKQLRADRDMLAIEKSDVEEERERLEDEMRNAGELNVQLQSEIAMLNGTIGALQSDAYRMEEELKDLRSLLDSI